MPQDFAKRQPPASTPANPLPRWVWFVSGVAVGSFVTFLAFVGTTVPSDPAVSPEAVQAPAPSSGGERAENEEMQWNFYDLFPRSEVPVHDLYATDEEVGGPISYLLQAGSFQNPDDADRLRGELILMGLDVEVRQIRVNGQAWHRVMVGPLPDEVELGRAQERLAEVDIAAIPIRVAP